MEPLNDPVNDRQCKTIKPPPHKPLTTKQIWPDNKKPDWKLIRDHLNREGRIGKQEIVKLIKDTNKLFKSESNLLYLQDPLTIIGDIHGQFYDLIKILEISGDPEKVKYLFLGDFVDRGSFSIEVLILLYAFKLNYPSQVYFLRGNHECRQMTSFFNFRDECLYKFDQEVYDMFMDSFDLMPLACVVNGKFFALHGGISPDMRTLDDLKKVDRFKEPPRAGLLCDLLWADPVDNDDGSCSQIYKQNDVRGCSYFYGNEAVCRFLEGNNLLSVIRAHEAQIEGYKMHHWNGSGDFPVVITIFSAPNYCDVYNNKGAVIKFDNNTLNIQQFNYSNHPYLLPNFMDIFTWSIPFVSEKVTECLIHLMKPREDENDLELGDDDDDDMDVGEFEKVLKQYHEQQITKGQENKQQNQNKEEKQPENNSKRLVNKLRFITKMMKYNTLLRENNEQIIKLKGLCPDSKIPKGLLDQGTSGIKNALELFNRARNADLDNEKRPDKK